MQKSSEKNYIKFKVLLKTCFQFFDFFQGFFYCRFYFKSCIDFCNGDYVYPIFARGNHPLLTNFLTT